MDWSLALWRHFSKIGQTNRQGFWLTTWNRPARQSKQQTNMRVRPTWTGANDPSQALRIWKKVRELLLDQPASTTVNYMRMMASGQIVNFSWREGILADDTKVYFEEARQLASAVGDIRAIV